MIDNSSANREYLVERIRPRKDRVDFGRTRVATHPGGQRPAHHCARREIRVVEAKHMTQLVLDQRQQVHPICDTASPLSGGVNC